MWVLGEELLTHFRDDSQFGVITFRVAKKHCIMKVLLSIREASLVEREDSAGVENSRVKAAVRELFSKKLLSRFPVCLCNTVLDVKNIGEVLGESFRSQREGK
jgi:hypothetical protein